MRWLMIVALLATLLYAGETDLTGTIPIKGAEYNPFNTNFYHRDSIAGDDTLYGMELEFWHTELSGFYNGYVMIRALKNNVKAKLYYREGIMINETTYLFRNPVLIDSFAAAETTGIVVWDQHIHTPPFAEFFIATFGNANDSMEIWVVFDPIGK